MIFRKMEARSGDPMIEPVLSHFYGWSQDVDPSLPSENDRYMYLNGLFGRNIETYCTQDGDELISFGSLTKQWMGDKALSLMLNVYVLPEKRGKGHGTKLVTELERAARENDMQRILLRAEEDLENFYATKFGYEVLHRMGEVEVVEMIKDLRAS